ncbi:sodium:solute symporter family protein [Rhodothermus marinus]|uniref:sodium:solute symporter family protein n=1 Tax=Rhodothermus marinus TaxID=29549 RepID=UPI000223DA9F|nr:sodium:solute symporter family protein [Rhodothermus marinus]AEN74140.1 Na+/solute symporter [Rhodothermus marinus SG0.5JP17-172]MBO2490882.1 sodium:solute symporter [Rhodothermus marinus]BBM71801.1 sodium:proline symporter [Rhodothermus marinus]
MVVFTWIDWLWVALYLLLMIGSGFFFYRLGKRSQSDFFLAGRGLPWWLPAASVYATHTATDTPMWVTGVIYRYGLAGIWYTFFSAWCAISAFVSTRIFRRSLAYTQAEWSVLRFGGLGAELIRGWMAGWQVFMNMFILGWVGIAMGKVCNFLFGWAPWVGLVVFSGACAIYVLAAGYWGVVVADFQQGIIAFFVIVLVSIWGIAEAGGPSAIVQKLTKMGEAHRLDPFAFTGWFTGDFPVAWFLTMLFIALLGGFGMGTTIDWFAEAQRIQSARTVRDASYSIWWGSALVLMRNALWAVAILAFYVMFPDIENTAEYELGWFRLGFDFLPAGLMGFFFAAIVAIHLSTISTHLNLGALYATRDIYQHYVKPHASERELVWVGRIATLILLIGSLIYGLMMEEITSWLIFALWIMAAGVWLPNILQVVWWRFNAWGYLSAWIANLGFSWLVVWVLPAFGVLPPLADYEQFWLLMVLGALVYIPVTLLTPPEDMDHLVKYYVMARPIGWWGPVRREAERRGLLTPKGQPAFVDPNQTRPS